MGYIAGLVAVLAAAPHSVPDIIVTGEKRAAPLKETTASVAVISREAIEDRTLRQVQEAYDRTANVAQAFGSSAFSIRGIVNYGVTGGGEAPTATVYVDGIPMASTFLQAAPTGLWDVESVEIFRGPQSTVQGLNALAGAVVIRTAEPSLVNWDGRARAIMTNEAQRGLAFAAGGPIERGELAFRLSAEAHSRDGLITNVTRNTGEDREASSTLHAKLLWQPGQWPGVELRLGYTHAARRGPYYTVYARTDIDDFPKNRIATDNVANTTDLRFDGASLSLGYALGDGIRLLGDSTWSSIRETSQFDGDYSAANTAFSNQQRDYRTFTQEVRLTVDRDRLKGVAGLFFYDRKLASMTASRTAVPTPVGTIASFLRSGGVGAISNGIAQAYGTALPRVIVDFEGSFPTDVRSYAAYADARIPVVGRVSLIAGFRAEHEVNVSQTIQRAGFVGSYPDPAAFGALAPVIAQINGAVGGLVAQASGSLPVIRRSFGTFLPKAGIALGVTANIETAFVAQRAYRSGGTSGNIARGQVYAYDPEYTWNYELSLRSSFIGGQLHLNGNAFYTDWRDQQVAVNFGLNAYDVNTVNAGKSHLYGFEAETVYQLRPSWAVYASLGHARTKFDRFMVQGMASNLSGGEFPFAPRWTVAAGTDARLSGGWGGSLNASYASRSFGAAGANQSAYRIAPHATVNTRLGYQGARWSAHLTGTNIFNNTYVMFKSPAESRAILNAPRVLGLELATRY